MCHTGYTFFSVVAIHKNTSVIICAFLLIKMIIDNIQMTTEKFVLQDLRHDQRFSLYWIFWIYLIQVVVGKSYPPTPSIK